MRKITLLLLLFAAAATAQTVDTGVGQTAAMDFSQNLDRQWRVQSGDMPVWAQTKFDDNAWPVVSLSDPSQDKVGWHWYRLHVQLPSPHPPLALLVFGGDGTYELFLNGQRLPGTSIANQWFISNPRPRSFPIGAEGGELVIALRTFVPSSELFSQDRGAWRITLGTQPAIDDKRNADLAQRLGRLEPSAFINLIIVLAGLIVLALYTVRRQHLEYLWLGISLVLLGIPYAEWTVAYLGFLPIALNAPGNSIFFISLAFQVEFTFVFAGRKVSRAWRLYQWLTVAAAASTYLLVPGILTEADFGIEQAVLVLPLAALLPIQLFLWYRRGNREAGWLIFPTMLSSLTLALYDFSAAAAGLGWKGGALFTRILQIGPVPLQQWDVANVLFVPAIGAVIFLRFTHLSREQARTTAELDAARGIQQRLVPMVLPVVAGFHIEAAYLPAAEVGGDFYQVLPLAGGSWLIVVGDVSGKGLKAAMTGAVAIGVIRSLAAENHSPAALIDRLNRQMVTAGNGGFITCLCAHISASGLVILANAGHLAPYRNSRNAPTEEVECEAALPLGLSLDATYAETTLQLNPGETLTLLTDGVLEATTPSGELFGFDRTAAVSVQTADQIAKAAQAFGQEDDITVLTLTFSSASEVHA